MKAFRNITVFVLLLTQICFAQEDYSNSSTDLKHQNFNHPGNFENRYGDKNSYKLRMGNNEIPLNTTSGQILLERQLDIVKNVLIDDFLVNDDLTGGSDQWDPSIAMDDNGNFVIVWEDLRNGNSDIYYQRYNSSGEAQGVSKKVNDDVDIGNEYLLGSSSFSIAMDVSGNFVIVWKEGRGDIYYQRYNSSGKAQGVNTRVNDDDGTARQFSPSIVMDKSGNFVIVWEDNRNGDMDIYFQRYNSSGEAEGANTKAIDIVGDPSCGCHPSIAMDGSGNFVIVWYDCRNGNSDIYYQRFNSSGEAQGLNTKVNDDDGTAWQFSPSIAMDESGNFVIVWEDERNGNSDIYYQRYNSSGEAQGINTKPNNDVGPTAQCYPVIEMDNSGNFVIAWEDDRNLGDERNGKSDIYYQRYNSSGEAQGINTKANNADAATSRGNFWAPSCFISIAMDISGNYVIVWTGRNEKWDIYFQRYNSSGEAKGVNTQAYDDDGATDQWFPSINMNGSGNFVIVWEDERNGNSDIYYQRYNSSGEEQGVNTKVNDDDGIAEQTSPSIVIDVSGNFVIVWDEWSGGCNYDIYYQQYNSSGEPLGGSIKVNDDVGTTRQEDPSIVMDGSGDFVIIWEDERYGNRDIYFQQYNNSGEAQGVNTKVNDDDGIAEQESPTIAMDGSGNFVVVWEDYRYGVNNPDIIGQRYFSNGNANGNNYRIVADGPNHCEMSPVLVANNDNIVFSWMDNRRSKGWDIYAKIVGWDWDGVTSVAELDNNLPEEFALFQNYPNPFNPRTTIKYSIPNQCNVSLKIFDVLGSEVETLVNKEQSQGNYEVEFDGSDLTSGIYFYRIQTGNFVETKKMILLK